jgi:hypothetical protein
MVKNDKVVPINTFDIPTISAEVSSSNVTRGGVVAKLNLASENQKFECELCIESYNLYDKKPFSLVPCGHTLCIKVK